jgi:hypothetical protein
MMKQSRSQKATGLQSLVLAGVALCIGGCSLFGESTPVDFLSEKKRLEDSFRLEQQGNCEAAVKTYSEVRTTSRDTGLLGRAILGEGRCRAQLRDFRGSLAVLSGLADIAASKDLAVEALYWTAVDYGGLQETALAIAAWSDLDQRLDVKSSDRHALWKVEVSIRLSEVYSRLQNFKEAERHLIEAERREKSLRQTWAESGRTTERLGKLYLQMGSVAQPMVDIDNFEGELKARDRSMSHLLQAATMGDAQVALTAQDQLAETYAPFVAAIDAVASEPSEDTVAAERKRQELRQKLAGVLRARFVTLKTTLNFSSDLITKVSPKLRDFIEQSSLVLDRLLIERPVGQGMTEEAIQREGLKRKVKLVPVDKAAEKTRQKD